MSTRNKPSSVPLRGRIIHLGPPLPTTSCGLPGTQTGRATPRPLFGLAPGVVCRATPVTRSPVRSYRTLSPLPVLLSQPSAVCSLLHFPSPLGARALPGTLPCGARTFLQWRTTGDPHSRTRLNLPHGALTVPLRALRTGGGTSTHTYVDPCNDGTPSFGRSGSRHPRTPYLEEVHRA